ncbi:hypothetical protein HNR63_000225 [Anoxybacillus kamchatkensis]|uniref:hypothetical protein n=1 Tax=Anoxybacillus ayderensis TaxID=265546 RepID=UPI0015EC52D6|nr:hypothetical protein [Anoxybacillus ayderensis]MBA2877198.1 hypothetical protein [Anoxybacillus ayderensis]
MKKKLWMFSFVFLCSIALFSAGVIAAPKVTLFFNNKAYKTDVRIINGKPYVPLADVVALFGGKMTYEKKSNSYKVTSKDYKPVSTSAVQSFNVNVTGSSGPMKIKIHKVTLYPSYKYDPYLPPIRAIVLDVTVENTSSNKVSWYPVQGTFALNTGEQIEDAILYSENVEGDFLGRTVKKGKIVLKVKSDLNAVRSMQYYIHGAVGDSFETIGEDVLLTIKWK